MNRRLNTGLMILAAVVLAAIVLTATATAGREPDTEQGGKRPTDQPPPRPIGQVEPYWQVPPLLGFALDLMSHPEVKVNVTENDGGVTLQLTTENPELAERLRAELPKRIEQMRERIRAGKEKAEELRAQRERPQRGISGPPELLAPDKVNVEVVPTDNGANIVITSDDPEVAARIRNTVPKHIEALRKRIAEQSGILSLARPMAELMLSPEVDIKLTETDKGVTLALTSEDQKVAERLKKVMAERVEHLQRVRKEIKESRERPQALRRPEEEPERPGRRLEEEPPRRPPEPELREIIRQEIRRYFEEKERESTEPAE